MSYSVKHRAGRLLRNWAIQSVNWYALSEVLGQIVLEGAFVILLAILGFALWAILVAWIVFHTVAWIFLYGGFMIVWKVFHLETDVSRLEAYRDRVAEKLRREPSLQIALFRGGTARGAMSARSDVDILGVPERGVRKKVRALLYWWGLRTAAAIHRIPVEARWVDFGRLVPYHVRGESPILVKDNSPVRDLRGRLSSRGLLVIYSGIDGSGKTTSAQDLVSMLSARGFRAVYFYGHRPAYLRGGTHVSFAIAFKSFWRHAGHALPELERYPRAKLVFDIATLLDYIYVQWKLSRLLRPNTIVVSDRYVADVIAYLRFLGPVRESLAGLLVRYSHEPDIAMFFDIRPEEALKRKQEQTPEELDRFARGYADLREVLELAPIDAGRPLADVRTQVEQLVARELFPASPPGPVAPEAPARAT